VGWSPDQPPEGRQNAGRQAGIERKDMNQGFRKNRRSGMIFGVCAGMADQFGIDVLWTRIAFVALTLLGFGLPLLLYLAVAILAP
jgi:phage shock protein PspC (stress-responsive transcriptional regulator)